MRNYQGDKGMVARIRKAYLVWSSFYNHRKRRKQPERNKVMPDDNGASVCDTLDCYR